MTHSYEEYSARFALSVSAFIVSSALALIWAVIGTLVRIQDGTPLYDMPLYWVVGCALGLAIVASAVAGLVFSYKAAWAPDETLRLRKSDEH